MAESVDSVLQLDKDAREALAEKVEKSRKVASKDFTPIYVAAGGPDGEKWSINRIKWLLLALTPENVAAAREEATDDNIADIYIYSLRHSTGNRL